MVKARARLLLTGTICGRSRRVSRPLHGTDDAAGVADHEGHRLGVACSAAVMIALFSILVVHDDDHGSGAPGEDFPEGLSAEAAPAGLPARGSTLTWSDRSYGRSAGLRATGGLSDLAAGGGSSGKTACDRVCSCQVARRPARAHRRPIDDPGHRHRERGLAADSAPPVRAAGSPLLHERDRRSSRPHPRSCRQHQAARAHAYKRNPAPAPARTASTRCSSSRHHLPRRRETKLATVQLRHHERRCCGAHRRGIRAVASAPSSAAPSPPPGANRGQNFPSHDSFKANGARLSSVRRGLGTGSAAPAGVATLANASNRAR
jgi:hypothetical protein